MTHSQALTSIYPSGYLLIFLASVSAVKIRPIEFMIFSMASAIMIIYPLALFQNYNLLMMVLGVIFFSYILNTHFVASRTHEEDVLWENIETVESLNSARISESFPPSLRAKIKNKEIKKSEVIISNCVIACIDLAASTAISVAFKKYHEAEYKSEFGSHISPDMAVKIEEKALKSEFYFKRDFINEITSTTKRYEVTMLNHAGDAAYFLVEKFGSYVDLGEKIIRMWADLDKSFKKNLLSKKYKNYFDSNDFSEIITGLKLGLSKGPVAIGLFNVWISNDLLREDFTFSGPKGNEVSRIVDQAGRSEIAMSEEIFDEMHTIFHDDWISPCALYNVKNGAQASIADSYKYCYLKGFSHSTQDKIKVHVLKKPEKILKCSNCNSEIIFLRDQRGFDTMKCVDITCKNALIS